MTFVAWQHVVDVLDADVFIVGPEESNSSPLCEKVFKGRRLRQALFLDRQPTKEERVATVYRGRLRGFDHVREQVSVLERHMNFEGSWAQTVSALIRSFEDIHDFNYDW